MIGFIRFFFVDALRAETHMFWAWLLNPGIFMAHAEEAPRKENVDLRQPS